MAVTGQFFFAGQGGPTESRIAYLNNDGTGQTVIADNNPSLDLLTSFVQDIAVDTAAGFYFALVNDGATGVGARLVRGSIANGGPATVVASFIIGNDASDANGDDLLVRSLHVDSINERIYVAVQDPTGVAALTGIKQFSYNPLTGAVTDLGFLVQSSVDATKPIDPVHGLDTLYAFDFDLNASTNSLYFTERLDGLEQGVYRLNLTTNAITQLVSSAQFPDSNSAGFVHDIEVDPSTNLVYFSTHSQAPSPDAGFVAAQNAIWYVPENASNATAIKLTLTGLPGGNSFYPGDFVIDETTRQLYVESEESTEGALPNNDVIYVFQLDGAGTSAALIRTITPNPVFSSTTGNIGGFAFNNIPILSSLNATATAAVEQSPAVVLLANAPTITDSDGDHLSSASVQITGGTFAVGDTSAADDNLGVGASLQTSGLIAGTNITISYNGTTELLTLTGYDTIANYQSVLASVRYFSTGNNPTNFGNNTSRTLTWIVSDGAIGIPSGSQNSQTSTVTITAVNDAPVVGAAITLAAATDNDRGTTGGNLLVGATDPDSIVLSVNSVTFSVNAPTLDAAELSFANSQITSTLQVNSATGAISFNPRALDGLGVGETGTVTFSYNISDGIANSAQTATSTISGANDGTDGDDVVNGRDGAGDQLRAGLGNDTINGLGGDDVISGEDGDDSLFGGNGNDVLIGGSGADELSGGSGLNQLIGGADNDLYTVTTRTDSIIELVGGGIDQVDTALKVYVLPNQVETLVFTGGAASFLGIGNTLDNIITGGTGVDQLGGLAGNDELYGNTGAANTLIGGIGDDSYYIDAAGDSAIEFVGEGIDTVFTSLAVHTLRANVENLSFNAVGSFLGVGNESGNTIVGGASNDFLSGMNGDDRLTGGIGSDELLGGAGADWFIFEGGEAGVDRIYDFATGSDKIALRDANFANSATLNFVQGNGVLVAPDTNSTFFYNLEAGTLAYDADGSGAGAAVTLAILGAGTTLVLGDIMFI